MILEDLIDLFTDSVQKIKVYSIEKEKDVYEGRADDCPDELLDKEVCSIDTIFNPTDTIVINVE